MSDRVRLAVPETLFVQPLLFGLNREGAPFELESDIGATSIASPK